MKADAEIAREEVLVAKSKESREYVQMIGEIDKVLGYDYELDGEGNIIRSSIVDAGDGKLDAEVEAIEANIENTIKETEIKERGMTETELTGALERILLETKEESEQYTVDNILPAQLDNLAAQVAKLNVDRKLAIITQQLGLMVDVFKEKQLDSVPEIITNQAEVEALYNSMLKDADDLIVSTIVPGGDNFDGVNPDKSL
jgi:hypothetical protein